MVDKFEAWLSAKLEVKKGGTGFQPGQARGGRSQCFGWPTAEEAARSIPEATVMEKGDIQHIVSDSQSPLNWP
jgi:hypothetical protein